MGFDVADSSTNFLFAEHPKYRAKDIQEYLKTRDIYVRYFSKKRIDNRLRITIGTDEENRRAYLRAQGLHKIKLGAEMILRPFIR